MTEYFIEFFKEMPIAVKLALLIGFALLVHLVVIVIRHFTTQALASHHAKKYRKLRSIGTLVTSGLIFTLYFLTVGFILKELGVSLTAYLASASVIGLAIGFGSQGIVQDVVTGLTFIFTDLIDVGDLVEVSGQTGIVKAITMRFIEIENAMGAQVFIPNRTINTIVNYPRGYVRCIVDINLLDSDGNREAISNLTQKLMMNTQEQFAGIIIRETSQEGIVKLSTGKEILRIKFRIWPNRGQAIEQYFIPELIEALTQIDERYQKWMIAITYESEARRVMNSSGWPWPMRSGHTAKAQ